MGRARDIRQVEVFIGHPPLRAVMGNSLRHSRPLLSLERVLDRVDTPPTLAVRQIVRGMAQSGAVAGRSAAGHIFAPGIDLPGLIPKFAGKPCRR